MRNIKLAIEKEQQYLKDKFETGDPNISLTQYLYSAGYRDIESFRFDKTEYQLKQLNLDVEYLYIDRESLDTWAERVLKQEVFFACADTMDPNISNVAIVGAESEEEYEMYKSVGITPITFNYTRGTIITSTLDFNCSLSVPKNIDLSMDFVLKKLLYFIHKTNPTAKIDSNDILVDNKKVVGLTSIENPNMSVVVAHISLTDYTDIIYKYCPPHAGKEPGFLTNLTKKDFENEILSWLKQ